MKTTKQTQKISIDELTPDPANVRRHTERNVRTTDASLRRFGPARSIVIDQNGVVRAGNQTLESAKAAGLTEVLIVDPEPGQLIAVRRSDWTPSEATAYAIADNRAADLAEFDEAALADVTRALQGEGFGPDELGFTDDEVNQMFADLAAPALIGGSDDAEPPDEFKSFDEDIETDYKCPSCSYCWSGKPK